MRQLFLVYRSGPTNIAISLQGVSYLQLLYTPYIGNIKSIPGELGYTWYVLSETSSRWSDHETAVYHSDPKCRDRYRLGITSKWSIWFGSEWYDIRNTEITHVYPVGIVYYGITSAVNPFRTAVPLWGQTTQISSSLSPKRDCVPKRVKNRPREGGDLWIRCLTRGWRRAIKQTIIWASNTPTAQLGCSVGGIFNHAVT